MPGRAKRRLRAPRIEHQMLPAHRLARLRDGGSVGPDAAAVVVELADGGVADVEGAAGQP